MTAILQTTFSNVFFNENVQISNKISLNCVDKNLIENNIGLDNGLAPTRRQVIIRTNDG